ncbi:MAG: hypothetical protein J6X58_03545 [Bacteroidales bacterium]|nr:hypothetical protein [Bacteroidales bacterium]
MNKYISLLLILVTLLVHSLPLQAQRHRDRQIIRAFPALGATASQIRGDELRGFNKWGITAGVGAAISLSNNGLWQMSLETDFSQRGAFNNTNDPYSIFGFTLNYVDIPLTVHFTDPWGGLTIGLGLQYSRLVQQAHGQIFYNKDYFIPDSSDMSFLKNDICAAIDMRFPIWKGLTFNIRYQHSLFPIKRNWNFTEYYSAAEGDFHTWSNNCYNSSISIRLLYLFGDDPSIKYRNKKTSKNKNNRKR